MLKNARVQIYFAVLNINERQVNDAWWCQEVNEEDAKGQARCKPEEAAEPQPQDAEEAEPQPPAAEPQPPELVLRTQPSNHILDRLERLPMESRSSMLLQAPHMCSSSISHI